MTEVVVVQPYVPQYRVPFFEGLSVTLDQYDVRLRVIAGEPVGQQAHRGDSARAPWLESVPTRILGIGARNIALTTTARLWKQSDAVIVPHQGSSLDSLTAVSRFYTRPVGVWGHIASYTSPLNPVDGLIERWQLRRAQHVFSYMPSGTAFARRAGVDSSKITTVMNTIDTTSLEAALQNATEKQLDLFRERHHISNFPYLAYVGGLDASKRIELLAEALDVLHHRGSEVHIVVAGRGNQEHLLHPAVARRQVTLIGYADTVTKASLLQGCAAIVNPGRVGLTAVDALISRRRLITTDWEWHAPEIEYLRAGETLELLPAEPAAFADGLEGAIRNEGGPSQMQWPPAPRIEDMVTNFARGVRTLLDR